MPYGKTERLPKRIRENLPKKAQKIFMESYNSAWKQYKSPKKRRGDSSRKEAAMKVAWNAVEKKYKKDSKTGKWKTR